MAGKKHAILWLHGLKGSSQDFKTAQMMIDAQFDDCIHVLPEAPTQWVSLDRAKGASWFDVPQRNSMNREQAQRSVQYINGLMEEYFDHEITVVGFSQGALMAIFYQQVQPMNIQSMILLGMPGFDPDEVKCPSTISDIPILVLQGDQDEVVALSGGHVAAQSLLKYYPRLEVDSYNNSHVIDSEAISKMCAWLRHLKQHS